MSRTLLPHCGQYGTRHIQQTKDICAIDIFHFFCAALFHCSQQSIARIIHQHIDASETRQRFADRFLHLCLIGHVHCNIQQVVMLVEIIGSLDLASSRHQLVACGEYCLRDFSAESAGSACNEPCFLCHRIPLEQNVVFHV